MKVYMTEDLASKIGRKLHGVTLRYRVPSETNMQYDELHILSGDNLQGEPEIAIRVTLGEISGKVVIPKNKLTNPTKQDLQDYQETIADAFELYNGIIDTVTNIMNEELELLKATV